MTNEIVITSEARNLLLSAAGTTVGRKQPITQGVNAVRDHNSEVAKTAKDCHVPQCLIPTNGVVECTSTSQGVRQRQRPLWKKCDYLVENQPPTWGVPALALARKNSFLLVSCS
jgi:hypothetical protein